MSCCWRITSLDTRTPSACSVVGAKPAMSDRVRAPTDRPVSLWAWVAVRHLVQPHQGVRLADRQRPAGAGRPDCPARSARRRPRSRSSAPARSSHCPWSPTRPGSAARTAAPPAITAKMTSLMVWSCSSRMACSRPAGSRQRRHPALLGDHAADRGLRPRPAAAAGRPRPAHRARRRPHRPPRRRPRRPRGHRSAARGSSATAWSGSCALSHSAPAISSTAVGLGHRVPGLRRRRARRHPGVGRRSSTWPMSTVSMPSTRLRCDLGHQGEPVVLQALDHVHLPQRPGPVEPAGEHPADELAELLHRAGSRQRRAADVIGQVEVLVVHPDRAGEPGRDAADPLPIARDVSDPLPDQPSSRS